MNGWTDAVRVKGNILFNWKYLKHPYRIEERRCHEAEPYNASRGEQSLWKAVILQAILDACGNNRKQAYQREKLDAIAWLTHEKEDFVDVCLCAGLDPLLVRQRAQHAILSPTQWHAYHVSSRSAKRRERWSRQRRQREQGRIKQIPGRGCLILNLNAS